MVLLLPVGVSVLLVLLLSGCGVHVDEKDARNKNVDIKTPFGEMSVHTDVDAKDTGLSVLPGARRKSGGDERDSHSANLNISSSMFGVKVVAVEFESDETPDKILDYYRKELGRYGSVMECHGGIDVHKGKDPDGPRELRCDEHRDRNETQLAAGTADRFHLVSVKPRSKGAEFGLVFIQTRSKETTM